LPLDWTLDFSGNEGKGSMGRWLAKYLGEWERVLFPARQDKTTTRC